jgi:hypothetical protein
VLLSSKVGLVFVVAFFWSSLSLAFAQIQDVTPPALTAFSFTPTTIDTSANSATVTVSIAATDDLAGVRAVVGRFLSPSGEQLVDFVASFPPATSVSGTIAVTLPRFSEVGTWTVSFLRVVDALDLQSIYNTTDLSQLGFPTELVVMGQAEDVAPPVISVSATPQTLWPPNGRMVTVTISGTITDAGSGVNASTTAYAVTDEYGLIQPSGRLIALGKDGSYSFTIPLQASRRGNDTDGRQYTITISAQDLEGNRGSASARVIVPHDLGG